MILEIEVLGYADAAGALLSGNQSAAGQHDALAGRLDGLAGMAGDDATATDFAAAYDAAAADALAGLADATIAFATLARLTDESLANHRRAEEASRLIPGAIVHDVDLELPPASYVTVLRSTPTSSLGADPPLLTPLQAWVLDHVEGFVWPDADVDRLREAGQAWRSAAAGLDDLAGDCDIAVRAFETQRSPEIPLAIAATTDLRDTITGLAVSCAGLGDHCDAHADAVEQKRAEILALVHEVLAIVVEGIVLGVALGAVTAGIGAAGGAAAIATRAAAFSPRFAAILASLRALTLGTAASVRLTHDAIRARRLRLERFLGVPARTEAGHLTLGSARWQPGWLARHEHSGSHTLSKHVGQTEDQLRLRAGQLANKRASSFSSQDDAEQIIESVLRRHSDALSSWLDRGSSPLRLDETFKSATGTTVFADGRSQVVNGVKVILRRDPAMPDGYRVLTAFPQP